MEVWQEGFSDHRIRDASDYGMHLTYIRQNPVRKNLSERAEDYLCTSAHAGLELDAVPQGLKPGSPSRRIDVAEATPLQNGAADCGTIWGPRVQDTTVVAGAAKRAAIRSVADLAGTPKKMMTPNPTTKTA